MKDIVREFTFNNQKFEVRRCVTAERREYAVYLDGKRVNPYFYSVSANETEPTDDMLVNLAEIDVRERVWESRLEALQELSVERLRSR